MLKVTVPFNKTWPQTMIYHSEPWTTMGHHELPCLFAVIDHVLLNATMIFDHGNSWSTTVVHGQPWYFMVDHSQPWWISSGEYGIRNYFKGTKWMAWVGADIEHAHAIQHDAYTKQMFWAGVPIEIACYFVLVAQGIIVSDKVAARRLKLTGHCFRTQSYQHLH